MIVEIDGSTNSFNLDRVILCSRSKFFKKACEGSWDVYGVKNPLVIRLLATHACHSYGMLKFIYTDSYESYDSEESWLLQNFHMFQMGRRYGVEGLDEYAARNLREGIKDYDGEDVIYFLDRAFDDDDDKEICDRQDIRQIVVQQLVHSRLQELVEYDWFLETLVNYPELAKDIVKFQNTAKT